MYFFMFVNIACYYLVHQAPREGQLFQVVQVAQEVLHSILCHDHPLVLLVPADLVLHEVLVALVVQVCLVHRAFLPCLLALDRHASLLVPENQAVQADLEGTEISIFYH